MNYDPNKLKPYLEQKNDATNKELYLLCNATTDGQKGSIRKLKSRILKAIEKGETVETPKQKTIKKAQAQVPPRIENDTKDLAHIIESIENPIAFASAHIFKKMIETGDVRWAKLYVSVLDKTNKLDYETTREQEWLKQANNMSMDDLVSKVAVKGSISKNILRRLEEAEDTSLYDNL